MHHLFLTSTQILLTFYSGRLCLYMYGIAPPTDSDYYRFGDAGR